MKSYLELVAIWGKVHKKVRDGKLQDLGGTAS